MIGIALLGAGRMARVHAKAIGAAGGKLVTVFDVAEPAAKALASESGASVARSTEEALRHPEVAAVLVATSSDTHVDCIIQATRAGKAVMCEKPLAPSLSEAQRCVDVLGATAGNVFVGFNRRFDAGHAALKKAIEAGEIGNLEQLTITSRDPQPPPLEYIPNSGGLFRDMMIHDFDMARWILGEEPVSIFSRGSCLVDPQIGKLGDIDTASVSMVTQSGKQAVILNSRRAVYGYDQRIEAFGSAGMLISDNPNATGLTRYSSQSFGAPDRFRAFFMERYGDSYRLEIETFLRGVVEGTPAPVNAIDGLRTAYLAEAAAASLQLGKAIELKANCEVTWA
ncbi:MAG TPA: inositol 2-dehydrogenase [Chthoniobacterales bacterium]|nr:inositol 2-dehydrogenase [Chthoniobacterales bacterium]